LFAVQILEDALLSIGQVPGEVPVVCMGVEGNGAKNGALLAAQILGTAHKEIKQAYRKYKEELYAISLYKEMKLCMSQS
jgi:5-(carboxyamino)imidazole ribonucleotide mutase